VLNKEAPDSSRNYAVGALLYAVADGVMKREELLTFLSSLFTGNETEPCSDFWSFIACDICDLCPDEAAYEVIKQAYADNLINDQIVAFEEFQEAIALGVEDSLNNLRRNKEMDIPENIHDAMSWWACFNANERINIPAFGKYYL
jgi:hypothetical protein